MSLYDLVKEDFKNYVNNSDYPFIIEIISNSSNDSFLILADSKTLGGINCLDSYDDTDLLKLGYDYIIEDVYSHLESIASMLY